MTETVKYSPPIAKLLGLGQEVARDNPWINYLERCDLTQEDVPELIQMMLDDELNSAMPDSDEVWAPLHAWRALGQLGDERAIDPLLKMLNLEEDSDWAGEEIPIVLEKIGPSVLPATKAFIQGSANGDFAKVRANRVFELIGKKYPEARDECVAILTELLKQYATQDRNLNANLVVSLVELNAIESADVIEQAFKADAVNLAVMGDWESAQIELGLLSERITPPPREGWIGLENPELASMFGELRAGLENFKRTSAEKETKGLSEQAEIKERRRQNQALSKLKKAKAKRKKKRKR